jgi:hypothetical protein
MYSVAGPSDLRFPGELLTAWIHSGRVLPFVARFRISKNSADALHSRSLPNLRRVDFDVLAVGPHGFALLVSSERFAHIEGVGAVGVVI